MSEEGPKQDAESTKTTETPVSSTPVIQTMTSDGIAAESSETKPVSNVQEGEEVAALVCCACCAACTLYVVCLPCEIVGFVVRILLLPFKCAILCCCPRDEKPPVPESETTA